MSVKTKSNQQLNDDNFVKECMDKLMIDYPQIKGYTYERVGDTINILLYGIGIE